MANWNRNKEVSGGLWVSTLDGELESKQGRLHNLNYSLPATIFPLFTSEREAQRLHKLPLITNWLKMKKKRKSVEKQLGKF